MKKSKTITMRDVAKQANVSIATVSRVLSQPETTRIENRERVYNAINLLNYNTKSLVKSYTPERLRSQKILILDNQFLTKTSINQGIEKVAKAEKFQLMYLRFVDFTDVEIQQIIQHVTLHHIEGIIIINDALYLQKIYTYRNALPPIVVVNHFISQLSCVYFDHLTIAFNATKYLVEHNHQKIACLIGLPDKQSSQYIKMGYIQALCRFGIAIDSQYFVDNCLSIDDTAARFKKLMQLPSPPSAILLCDNNNLNNSDESSLNQTNQDEYYWSESSAINGLLYQAEKMKVSIPNDLSFIYLTGSDDINSGNHMDKNSRFFTHIHKPSYIMGQEGLTLLISLLHKNKSVTQSKIIDSKLVIRHSVVKKSL